MSFGFNNNNSFSMGGGFNSQGGGFNSGMGMNQNTPEYDDFEVQGVPGDTISSISFPPDDNNNHFVVSSWDNSVYLYEIQFNGDRIGGVQGKAKMTHPEPVLATDWSQDGRIVLTGGCDKLVKAWQAPLMGGGNGQEQTIGQHDGPVCFVACHGAIIISASWDQSIRYWDMNKPGKAVGGHKLDGKILCAHKEGDMLAVVQTGQNCCKVMVIDLRRPNTIHKSVDLGDLKHLPRSISVFPDLKGFVVGTIGGRVSVHELQSISTKSNFKFKCHRTEVSGEIKVKDYDVKDHYAFAVNAIAFHKQSQTLMTAGSEGSIQFWRKDERKHVISRDPCTQMGQMGQRQPQPITTAKFNSRGNLLGYCMGYDWSRGHEYNNPAKNGGLKTRIRIRHVHPNDLHVKKK